MTLSGPDALKALDDALRDIRREEDEIVRKLGRSGERLAKIRETEADLLSQFAHGRIGAEVEVELTGAISRAGIVARQALKQRAGDTRLVADRLRQLESRLGELVSERREALDIVDRQQTALRGLSSRIAAAIARDPDYGRHQQVARDLKSIAIEAQAKARQADVDREQKGRPYRADRLFMYLQGRGYGTAAYKGLGLTSYLDGRIAKFIDYPRARQHYQMLNDLPALLHAHAEMERAKASEAEDAIDDIERAAVDAAGGASVRSALAEAQARMEAADAEVVEVQDRRDAVVQAYAKLAEAMAPELERAVGALAQALGADSVQDLIAMARLPQTAVDNPIVAQLNDVHLRIVEEQIDARDEHVRLRTLAARRRELEDLEYEFKALKFDDPRSIFRDDDLTGSRFSSFLTGTTTAPNYWAAWRRSQSWTVGTSDWGGGIGLPRHGRLAGVGAAAEPTAFSRPRPAQASVET